jgi:APA family basic amino acid/polyamine antiporter
MQPTCKRSRSPRCAAKRTSLAPPSRISVFTRARLLLTPLVAVSILSSLQATVLTGPRIYQAMAEDGLFFAPLGRIHPRSHVPVTALVAQAVMACVLLMSGTFDRLLTFATFAILIFSTITVCAIIVLRIRFPGTTRAFRTPLFPVVPLFFIAANIWVIADVLATGAFEALTGVGIVTLGVAVYLWFRRSHEHLTRAT